jgi:hypothetical protein
MSLADTLVTVIDQGNYARVDHHCIIKPPQRCAATFNRDDDFLWQL